MREQQPALEKLVRLGIVVQGTAPEAARFCGRHGVEPLCIPDPQKESYQAMGFRRCSWKELVFAGAGLKQRRAEAAAAGCAVNLPGAFQRHSDWLQLPGAALVARGGRILWIHSAEHAGDLPSAADLLRVVEQRLAADPAPEPA